MSVVILDHQKGLLDLANLACKAAEELDLLSQGLANDRAAVKELTTYLRSVTTSAESNQADPVASMRMALVRRAMSGQLDQPQELPTLKDVVDRAASLAGQLEEPSDKTEELVQMRDFCLALSVLVAAEGRLRSGSSSPMKYRK